VALFLDRLSVHRSIKVRDLIEEKGMRLIFNASYSPEYNAVEGCFSLAKNYIKRQRLNAIIGKRKINLEQLILDSIYRISKDICKNFVNDSNNKLR
jgi:transposase